MQFARAFSHSPALRIRAFAEGKMDQAATTLPGKHGDPLLCSLFAVDFEKFPAYQAISYVWGDPQKTVKIKCGGQAVHITINLNGAFQRIRHTSDTLVLWADAICIDQNNVSERGHQVDLMGLIFQYANRVLVWLGEDTYGDVEDACDLILKTNRYFETGLAEYSSIDSILYFLQTVCFFL